LFVALQAAAAAIPVTLFLFIEQAITGLLLQQPAASLKKGSYFYGMAPSLKKQVDLFFLSKMMRFAFVSSRRAREKHANVSNRSNRRKQTLTKLFVAGTTVLTALMNCFAPLLGMPFISCHLSPNLTTHLTYAMDGSVGWIAKRRASDVGIRSGGGGRADGGSGRADGGSAENAFLQPC
jgi:hypothetical protein